MKRYTLRNIILDILTERAPALVPKDQICSLVLKKQHYTPDTIGRELRKMERDSEHIIQVQYIRGHAHYRVLVRGWQKVHVPILGISFDRPIYDK